MSYVIIAPKWAIVYQRTDKDRIPYPLQDMQLKFVSNLCIHYILCTVTHPPFSKSHELTL